MNMQGEIAMNKWSNLTRSAVVALTISVGLAGCGAKGHDSKSGQALVSVNGKEITIHQLNEEMARANVQQAQREAASKQILNALVDRQLLEQAAIKAKVDRDPNVMQAIERAKSQLVAQAYLQSKVANVAKPEKAEIEAFYNKNPQLFAQRKLVEMEQLLIDTKFINDEFKAAIGGLKSLQETAAWLDAKGIQYDRGEVARSVAELPPQISERLKDARKGQLFVIGMGPRTMLVLMDSVKDSPVSLTDAAPQIEQMLLNQKRKDAGEAEIKQLRSAAKIVYLDGSDGKNAGAEATAGNAFNGQDKDDAVARGVSGLK